MCFRLISWLLTPYTDEIYNIQALRQLVQCADGIGRAMTPYYKQFLQPMNTFLDRVKNIGDTIDYGQRNNDDIGEEVRLTLEIMERYGTEDAFKFIKFAIPPCMFQ